MLDLLRLHYASVTTTTRGLVVIISHASVIRSHVLSQQNILNCPIQIIRFQTRSHRFPHPPHHQSYTTHPHYYLQVHIHTLSSGSIESSLNLHDFGLKLQ